MAEAVGGDALRATSPPFSPSSSELMELARKSGKFDEESLEFQSQILKSSGIGDETYLPRSVGSNVWIYIFCPPPKPSVVPTTIRSTSGRKNCGG